ncbi:MAG: hypothetical protein ABSH08_10600 [Tepidisphaeraceae bacterium]
MKRRGRRERTGVAMSSKRKMIEKQAKYLAAENRKNDPDIKKVYWFPDEAEVRLVEVHTTIPKSLDGEIRPFYFRPDPAGRLPAPSGIALIRPDEAKKLPPPTDWGGWDIAEELK